MRNELWQVILEQGLTEDEINRYIYKVRKTGSPYVEIEDKIPEGSCELAVNPYIRLGRILAPLLEDRDFCEAADGQLLFHEAVRFIFDLDRVSGADRDTFVKALIYDEIAGGCYGREIAAFFAALGMQEKSAVLDYLLQLYRGGSELYPFIGVVLLLFPQSIVFREKQKPDIIYICMNTKKNEWQSHRYKAAKALLLPVGITIKLSWEQPFVLTDINNLEQYGNTLA